jgi:hypothetical protein
MQKRQMHVQTDGQPAAFVVPQLRLPSVASAVQGMLNRALVYCAGQMRLNGPQEAVECLRQGDRVARWYCHHNLGAQAAETLGDLDDTVQQVLVFDLEGPLEDLIYHEAGPPLPVHLVVHVEHKTESLNNLAQALGLALDKEYARAVGCGTVGRVLEIQLIDADDIEKRRGYAGVLGSLLDCPIQVWQRSP